MRKIKKWKERSNWPDRQLLCWHAKLWGVLPLLDPQTQLGGPCKRRKRKCKMSMKTKDDNFDIIFPIFFFSSFSSSSSSLLTSLDPSEQALVWALGQQSTLPSHQSGWEDGLQLQFSWDSRKMVSKKEIRWRRRKKKKTSPWQFKMISHSFKPEGISILLCGSDEDGEPPQLSAGHLLLCMYDSLLPFLEKKFNEKEKERRWKC